MKLFVVGIAALCLLAPPLRAQDDAAKRAKVEELFTVMRLDHTMDQLLAAIRQQTAKLMQSQPGYDQLSPQQKQLTEDFQKKVMAVALDSVGWKAIEPDMVNLYATTYSLQEIDGLLTFYKSPVGQTMLDNTPELTKKSLGMTQQRIATLQPKLQEMLTEFSKQMAAAAPAKTGTGTSTGTSTAKPGTSH